MADDLEPCPFCGYSPILQERYGDGRKYFFYLCPSCYAEVAGYAFEDAELSKREAIKQWNQRAPNKDAERYRCIREILYVEIDEQALRRFFAELDSVDPRNPDGFDNLIDGFIARRALAGGAG